MPFQILSVSAYLSVSMSPHFTAGCSTQAPRTCVFCGLAQFLGVPHLPQRLPSSPRQPNSPVHIFVRPLLCADISSHADKQSSPFASIPVLPPPGETSCFLLPEIGILSSVCLSSCPFFGSPVRLLSTSSVIPFPAPRVERCHPQISNLLSFHLRCQPLRLIHPVPLP